MQDISELWNIVFDEIAIFNKDLLQAKNTFLHKVQSDIEKCKRSLLNEYNEWMSKHDNPVKRLANGCLDDILKYFNLKVLTDLDLEKEEDIKFIKLVQQNNPQTNVPYRYVSTGTKQEFC